MDLKLLRHLVRLMERGELNELKIDDQKSGLSVHFKRGGSGEAPPSAPVVMMSGGASAAPVIAEAAAAGAVPAGGPHGPAGGPGAAAEADPSGLHEIKSPMVGTFYRAPSPEAEPFVSEGADLGQEDVVCVIEAMKVMNEIKAECRGQLVQILVENGDPVEFGQPLFLVKPS